MYRAIETHKKLETQIRQRAQVVYEQIVNKAQPS